MPLPDYGRPGVPLPDYGKPNIPPRDYDGRHRSEPDYWQDYGQDYQYPRGSSDDGYTRTGYTPGYDYEEEGPAPRGGSRGPREGYHRSASDAGFARPASHEAYEQHGRDERSAYPGSPHDPRRHFPERPRSAHSFEDPRPPYSPETPRSSYFPESPKLSYYLEGPSSPDYPESPMLSYFLKGPSSQYFPESPTSSYSENSRSAYS